VDIDACGTFALYPQENNTMNDWAEFRHFRYLLAIVEHKGFRAAAEHLRTAEPNLSVQAKQFQEAFAIQLFKRGKSGRIELTETGVAFKAIAQGVLDARDEAIAALIAIERGQIRALNLGCTTFVDPEVFRVACEIHKEVVPSCPIRPTHGDASQLVQELALGEIDAAIMTMPVIDSRLSFNPLPPSTTSRRPHQAFGTARGSRCPDRRILAGIAPH